MKISYKTYTAYLDLVIAEPTAPQVIKTVVTAYIHSVRAKLDIIGVLGNDKLYENYYNITESLIDVISDTDGFQTYGDSWLEYFKEYFDVVSEYHERSSDVDWTQILGGNTCPLFNVSIKSPVSEPFNTIIHEVVNIMNSIAGTTVVTLW